VSRVWVTRAEPGAAATAERLRARGHEPLVDPVLAVRETGAPIELEGVAALAFTSANGVRAFARSTLRRDLPVFAVGEATAEAARAAGFAAVEDAKGDVHALAALLTARRPGPVLHVGAADPAADLPALLAARGLSARSVAVYETVAVRPAAALAALDRLDVVLLHSPRAARAVADRLTPEQAGRLSFAAISAAAARPLLDLGWKRAHASLRPDEASLLALLDEITRP
jgi:uroporphyrinogen-III synthase